LIEEFKGDGAKGAGLWKFDCLGSRACKVGRRSNILMSVAQCAMYLSFREVSLPCSMISKAVYAITPESMPYVLISVKNRFAKKHDSLSKQYLDEELI
jgi:hypothetical protein